MAHYWPYYCEENVWWLANETKSQAAAAMFISGSQGQVVMAAQSAGEPPHGMLSWDYHVVFLCQRVKRWVVVDPDCVAPNAAAGLPLHEYARISFPNLTDDWAHCAPLFRIIEAPRFVSTFASDRRHMRADDGTWLKPPPPWPCIGEGHNLDRLNMMSGGAGHDLLSLDELLRRYGD